MSERTTSAKALWMTWASLLALLAATFFAARVDLGLGNTIVALLISGLKMALVILFFMQVRYSSRLVWVFVCAGFVWWMIFISFAMTDYLTRRPVVPYDRGAPTPGSPLQNATETQRDVFGPDASAQRH